MATMNPIAIDLFSGVGGLSLGLKASGFDVRLSVEIEEQAGRYAQYNFPQSRVLYGDEDGDVRKFGRNTVLRHLERQEVEQIALVAGGPPCQGFSLAGKKQADDPLNDLVLEFARVVLELKPLAFVMENVPGITKGNSPHLREAIRRLNTTFHVGDPALLKANHFGVPQGRERVFVIGIRRDLGVKPTPPSRTHADAGEDSLFGSSTPTVWDAIGDLPNPDAFPELVDGDRIPYNQAPHSEFARAMRDDPRSDGFGFPKVVWNSDICTNVRRTQHGPALLHRFASLGFEERDRISGITRLHPDKVSTTIRAGTTAERGSWSAPRPLHPYQNRVLSTRECARLQSFPDWFLFHPVKWHGNRQVGNAVPPLLARAVGSHVLGLLGIPAPAAPGGSRQSRDESLISADVEAAQNSGLSRRRMSFKVSNTSRAAWVAK